MTTTNDTKIVPNEADSIIEAARAGSIPIRVEPGEIYVVSNDDGERHVIDTDQYLAVPRDYRRFYRDIGSLDSFIEYLAAHDGGDTEIWATLNPARTNITVEAFLDANTHASQHVRLEFEETRRWKEWQAVDRNFYGQEAFAEFLEDHTEDLIEPDAAKMLEIAQSLRASIKTTFQSGKRLDNGQAQLVYKEEIDGSAGKGGTLTIPENITIGVQPYTTSDIFKMEAKFRYRIQNGELRLGIKLMNTDQIVEHLFNQIVAGLNTSDVAPVYLGTH